MVCPHSDLPMDSRLAYPQRVTRSETQTVSRTAFLPTVTPTATHLGYQMVCPRLDSHSD
jgi:hypothetical protein